MPKAHRKIDALCMCQLREDSGDHVQILCTHTLQKERKDVAELPKNTNSRVRKILEDNCRPKYLFS